MNKAIISILGQDRSGIADEMSIGVINNKTTATRLIPVPGKKAGNSAYFGGLLGQSTIIPVSHGEHPNLFVQRGKLIPAPLQSLTLKEGIRVPTYGKSLDQSI
ncbi:MAG: DUF711 family protein [Desulfobacterales bacterium]|jgi:uncharacterized protein (UPF0210 family)